MAREATGSPKWSASRKCWVARISMAGHPRTPVALPHDKPCERTPVCKLSQPAPCSACAEAIRLAKLAAQRAQKLGMVPLETGKTVNEWFEDWVEDRVRRGLTSTRDDRSHYTHHVADRLGTLPMAAAQRADLEGLVEALDGKVQRGELSWKSALNVWATVSKMFDDAANAKTRSLRVRNDNPAKDVRGPDRGNDRSKQFLYPSEFLTFVESALVPTKWKRAVAIAIYVFPRDGEQRVLTHNEIDLEHETVHIHKAWDRRERDVKSTKTKATRRFAIERNLLPLLRLMYAEAEEEERAKGTEQLAERAGSRVVIEMPSERDMSRGLRRWLKKAGVKRRELFEDTATTKALTWHDLRATGLTWLAIRGDEPLRIMQRAGHERFETTQRYVREAENLRDGFGEVFPPLPAALTTPPAPPSNWSPNGQMAGPPVKGPAILDVYCGADGTRRLGNDDEKRRVDPIPAIVDTHQKPWQTNGTEAISPIVEDDDARTTQLAEERRGELVGPEERPRGNQGSQANADKSRGETYDYLAAPIARDAPEVSSPDDELRALAKRYIDAGEPARAMSLLALISPGGNFPHRESVADRDVKPGNVIRLDTRRWSSR